MSVKRPANSLLRKILIINNERTKTIAVFLCKSNALPFYKTVPSKILRAWNTAGWICTLVDILLLILLLLLLLLFSIAYMWSI